MKYVEVCKALYDYEARTDEEISVGENDILYIIEKEDAEWWRAELKQSSSEEQGPVGLVPADYLEKVTPIGRVRAEFDYEAQQEEELSFEEGEEMELIENDDPDWYLVKLANGQIGLAPSNYVQPVNEYHEEAAHEETSSAAVTSPVDTTADIVVPQAIMSQPTGQREVIQDDAQSWGVQEYDAEKKKKKKGKGNLFVGNGMICYGSGTDKSSAVQQYPILDVTKYLCDSKILHIEINGSKQAVLDLQASSKSEAKAILTKIADSIKAAQISGVHLNQQSQTPPPQPPRNVSATPPVIPQIQRQQQQTRTEEPVYYQQEQQPEHHEEEQEESNCVPKWGISIYSFNAEGDNELSVEENEQIYVLDYERTDGWWRVQKVDGEVGLVPSSFVNLDDDKEEGHTSAATYAAGITTAAAAAAATSQPKRSAEDLEEMRRRREEEEYELQQRRSEEAAAREQARLREQEIQETERRQQDTEERRRKEDETRRREEERNREEDERKKHKQAQEAAKYAEQAHRKQIEEDYKRKGAERAAAVSRSTSAKSSSSNQHRDLPKPDPTKLRTWTDRSGSFKVEAQFIDFRNGKLRLHKTNGVKIDVPMEKMCAEDIHWVEKYSKKSQDSEEVTPSMPPRPHQPQEQQQRHVQPAQPTQPPQKKLNERWDWFDWFMVIGIPMQASLQYASAFKGDRLDNTDIHNLTHKQMKGLGIKEDHVQRIERYIETGKPELNEEETKQMETSQMEKDEELARKLQSEWENSDKSKPPVLNRSNSSGTSRPKPAVSAPKDVHPDLLDFIGGGLSSSVAASENNNRKGKQPENPTGDLVGFNDDAWALRSSTSPQQSSATSPMKPTTVLSPTPVGPSPEEIKAKEEERKRSAEEEQIQKIQLMNLQRQAKEQQKQLEELQRLTQQQLELQKQLAMQTGTQQQQQQQQQQMLQVQAQQAQIQAHLNQQPAQLQPSFQPTLPSQQTGVLSYQTGASTGMNTSVSSTAGRPRPTPNNRLLSDSSLGQWRPNNQQPTGFNSQQQQTTGFNNNSNTNFALNNQMPTQTGFQSQQQYQSPSWQGQALQPQMTGFPSTPSYQQPMATATVSLSSLLPQPLTPSVAATAGQQQHGGGLQRAQTMNAQPTGRNWSSATPANPFGSPTLSPLQAQMTGVQFSTPSPHAFNQSPLQQPQQTGFMQQPQMTGFQQPQPTGNNIFTPQGSMQYGQAAFSNNQRPW